MGRPLRRGLHAAAATDPALLEQGGQLHADYCAACHSRPASAVLAYPLALATSRWQRPPRPDRTGKRVVVRPPSAQLPGLDAAPFQQAVPSVGDTDQPDSARLGPAQSDRPANRPTRRALGLDACTHRGVRSRHRSVAPIFQVIPNREILPSEKLAPGQPAWQTAGRHPGWPRGLAEASFISHRLRPMHELLRCPSGIDLQDLWAASKSDLIQGGHPDPHGWIRRHTAPPLGRNPDGPRPRSAGGAASRRGRPCARPIIPIPSGPACSVPPAPMCARWSPSAPTPSGAGDDAPAGDEPDALAAQRGGHGGPAWCGIASLATNARSIVPRGVRVADVLYELRNEACRRLTSDEETTKSS
ncbi:MAG: hypothetical protein MZV70_29370 [Desulfobacterales bacterium]|nr:hypothetical protein [Desulfobacterales bacterium]